MTIRSGRLPNTHALQKNGVRARHKRAATDGRHKTAAHSKPYLKHIYSKFYCMCAAIASFIAARGASR